MTEIAEIMTSDVVLFIVNDKKKFNDVKQLCHKGDGLLMKLLTILSFRHHNHRVRMYLQKPNGHSLVAVREPGPLNWFGPYDTDLINIRHTVSPVPISHNQSQFDI